MNLNFQLTLGARAVCGRAGVLADSAHVTELEAASRAHPADAARTHALAVALLAAHLPACALDAADSTILLNPTWAEAWLCRCEALLGLLRYVDVVRNLQQVQ